MATLPKFPGTRHFPSSPRGIPAMFFIENMDKFMESQDNGDSVLAKLNQNKNQYQKSEVDHLQKLGDFSAQQRELEMNLRTINQIEELTEENKDYKTVFSLGDTVMAHAVIPKNTDHCYVWLDSKTCIELNFDEARDLFQKQLEKTKNHIKEVNEDLDFLKRQITICEVSYFRVYNWTVLRARQSGKQKK
eukprot:TRINITY_DN1649_c0_g1_i1.p1 TRINITY_DN1649_c0_g1~~TRINITY_DN1649_c0_g1_i1.p1  ORF type:complete len:190 (+),score=37.49 TRINITY_DN1649_c0_g1_i1:40-609(+)